MIEFASISAFLGPAAAEREPTRATAADRPGEHARPQQPAAVGGRGRAAPWAAHGAAGRGDAAPCPTACPISRAYPRAYPEWDKKNRSAGSGVAGGNRRAASCGNKWFAVEHADQAWTAVLQCTQRCSMKSWQPACWMNPPKMLSGGGRARTPMGGFGNARSALANSTGQTYTVHGASELARKVVASKNLATIGSRGQCF